MVIEGQRTSPRSRGRQGDAVTIYLFETENHYAFTIENSQDGKNWSKVMEGKFTRK